MVSRTYPTLTFKRSKLEIRPRLLWGVAGIAAIVLIGILTNDGDIGHGALLGISAAIGAVLGVVLKPEPIEKDHALLANAALGRLVTAGRALSDNQIVVTELAAESDEPLTAARLINVQDGLRTVREGLELVMTDWDSVAPGSIQAVIEDNQKAARIFREMVERSGND